jgi:hypothetical protein
MLDRASFEALGLSDAHLTRIEWVEGGRDLEIALTHASGNPITLRCEWVHARRIELRTPEQRGGHPLTWGAALELSGNDWHLVLDFAGEGSIDLLCGGVSVGSRA